MTTETKRDLHADLALCAAATGGPWFASGEDERPIVADRESVITARGSELAYVGMSCEDEEFIAESREGWPEALRRAIAAEAEVERLAAFIESESEYAIDMIAENERLRRGLVEIRTRTYGCHPSSTAGEVYEIVRRTLRPEVTADAPR